MLFSETEIKEVINNESLTFDELYTEIGQFITNPADSELVNFNFFAEDIQAITQDFWKKKAYEFLKKYWKNISTNACEWWKNNKEKFTEFEIVAKLLTLVVSLLPPPYSALSGVIKFIVSLLLKGGIDTICEKITEDPPIS